MNNAPHTLEIVSPSAASAAPRETDSVLAKHVECIKACHSGVLRAWKDQMGYAFLAGLGCLALKEKLHDEKGHGHFEKFCAEQLPDLPKRTRQVYMSFCEKLIDKNATVALLAKQPRLLTTSEVAEDDAKAITKAVHDAADGKTLTELYRDLGVIRQPKPKVHTPPKPESPDDALASEKEQHESVLNDIVIAINLALENLDSPDSPLRNPAVLKTRQAAVDACARFQREVANLKTRRSTL